MSEAASGDARLTVWVDADSCPVPVREILNRAAPRRGFDLIYCANRRIRGLHAPAERRRFLLITDEPVDDYLQRHVAAGRVLLITRDIPLAERILAEGVSVMNDRGEIFDPGTIAERRSIRDAAEKIRAAGLETMPRRGGFGDREKKAFADALDRYVTSVLK